MPEQKNANTETTPPSAEQLRMQMLEREMEQMDKERKLRSMQEQKLTDFAADFLEKHVTEQEIAVVRRLVANAVKDGKFEAMVYSFPSSLCTDSGLWTSALARSQLATATPSCSRPASVRA